MTIKTIPLTCTGHSRPVTHLSFSHTLPDGGYLLLSSCKDGIPMIRDGITGDWIGSFLGHKGATWSAVLSPDSHLVVTCSADFSAIVWTTTTGKPLFRLPHNHIVRSAAFCESTNRFIITSSQDKQLCLWDLGSDENIKISGQVGTIRDLKPICTCDSDIIGYAKTVIWTKADYIFTAGSNNFIAWWKVVKSKGDDNQEDPIPISLSLESHADLNAPLGQFQLTCSDSLIIGPAGSNIYIIDPETRQITTTIPLDVNVSSADVNKDKTLLAVGSSDDTWLRIYPFNDLVKQSSSTPVVSSQGTTSIQTATPQVLKSHHGPVHSVVFSPDGKICASGSEDGTVRLWKVVPGAFGLWKS